MLEYIQTEEFWLYAIMFGYPIIAVVSFPVAYWNTRAKQIKMDNIHAYVWGWLAALFDALVMAIFWPIWVVMFIGGALFMFALIIYRYATR